MSTGGGDGGAADMRKQEAARQKRINDAVTMINGVFNGTSATTVGGQLDAPRAVMSPSRNGGSPLAVDYGAFDPNQTYYRADGSEWRAPTVSRTVAAPQAANGMQALLRRGQPASRTVTEVDRAAVANALKQGLYTDRNTYTPSGTPRQALYDEQKKAVTELNTQDVQKQFTDAERNARFGLARQGLLGGSEDVNVRADLTERQNKGLMQAAALGDSAAADLKTQDERARQSLISMAQSGIDTGTAQSMAMKQLDAAAQAAKGDRQAATVGDLFGNMAQAYMVNRTRQGMLNGQQQYGGGFGSANVRNSYSGNVT